MGTYIQNNAQGEILEAPISIAGWDGFPVKQSPECGFYNELCPTTKPDDTNNGKSF